ncbi:MAG: hypothetical protein KAU12_04225, partial [Candidatus Omnitrophica bacterium]|nr:hypothetical protein [Candidatus Omnitrophota bacterium]
MNFFAFPDELGFFILIDDLMLFIYFPSASKRKNIVASLFSLYSKRNPVVFICLPCSFELEDID